MVSRRLINTKVLAKLSLFAGSEVPCSGVANSPTGFTPGFTSKQAWIFITRMIQAVELQLREFLGVC